MDKEVAEFFKEHNRIAEEQDKKLKPLYKKSDELTEKLKKAYHDCSPVRRKSEFITCSKCGSRYPKKDIKEVLFDFTPCCVCGDRHSLYSATSIKRIEKLIYELSEVQRLMNEATRYED